MSFHLLQNSTILHTNQSEIACLRPFAKEFNIFHVQMHEILSIPFAHAGGFKHRVLFWGRGARFLAPA